MYNRYCFITKDTEFDSSSLVEINKDCYFQFEVLKDLSYVNNTIQRGVPRQFRTATTYRKATRISTAFEICEGSYHKFYNCVYKSRQ